MIDTAASLLLSEALDVIIDTAGALRDSIGELAWKYRYTPTVGRSHGIHAEPTTFGLKMLGYVSEIERDISRLSETRSSVRRRWPEGPGGQGPAPPDLARSA